MEAQSNFLSGELWDLILNFTPAWNLSIIRCISKLFKELIELNIDLKNRLFIVSKPEWRRCIGDWGETVTEYQFEWAARNGYMNILEWLHSRNNLYEIMDGKIDDIFAITAKKGKLGVIKWIYFTFGLSKKNTPTCTFMGVIGNRYDLVYNCEPPEETRLKVLKWLYSTFDIFVFEYTTRNIFIKSAEKGNLKILKWLHSIFSFTRKDATFADNYSFRCAAKKGHLEILKWIHSTFDLTTEDVEKCNCDIFRCAEEHGQYKVLDWLKVTFN